jgi:hypothetical protein
MLSDRLLNFVDIDLHDVKVPISITNITDT